MLYKLQAYLAYQDHDLGAAQAARDVLRYFDIAAPLHHRNEELQSFRACWRCGSRQLLLRCSGCKAHKPQPVW